MAGDLPVSRRTLTADSPWDAAQKATGKEVRARREERLWVRVTDERSRAVYKYAVKFAARADPEQAAC